MGALVNCARLEPSKTRVVQARATGLAHYMKVHHLVEQNLMTVYVLKAVSGGKTQRVRSVQQENTKY